MKKLSDFTQRRKGAKVVGLSKAIHFLAVVICLSPTGGGRAAGAPPAKDKVVVFAGAAVIDGTDGLLGGA